MRMLVPLEDGTDIDVELVHTQVVDQLEAASAIESVAHRFSVAYGGVLNAMVIMSEKAIKRLPALVDSSRGRLRLNFTTTQGVLQLWLLSHRAGPKGFTSRVDVLSSQDQTMLWTATSGERTSAEAAQRHAAFLLYRRHQHVIAAVVRNPEPAEPAVTQ